MIAQVRGRRRRQRFGRHAPHVVVAFVASG